MTTGDGNDSGGGSQSSHWKWHWKWQWQWQWQRLMSGHKYLSGNFVGIEFLGEKLPHRSPHIHPVGSADGQACI